MHIFPCDLLCRYSVNPDIAFIGLIKTHQKINHGGFSGSRGSDYRNLLPCLKLRRKIMDYGLVRQITEFYVRKADIAPDLIGIKAGALLAFVRKLFGLKYFKTPL